MRWGMPQSGCLTATPQEYVVDSKLMLRAVQVDQLVEIIGDTGEVPALAASEDIPAVTSLVKRWLAQIPSGLLDVHQTSALGDVRSVTRICEVLQRSSSCANAVLCAIVTHLHTVTCAGNVTALQLANLLSSVLGRWPPEQSGLGSRVHVLVPAVEVMIKYPSAIFNEHAQAAIALWCCLIG